MLKFFRKYNKWILAIGCSVLMVAFLLPNATSFLPQPDSRPVGELADGTQFRIRDLQFAQGELGVYERLQPVGLLATSMLDPGERELHWLMIQAEADAMGLAASQWEVSRALELLGVSSDETLATLAADFKTTPAGVRRAIADWLVAEQYRDLMSGKAFDTANLTGAGGENVFTASSPGIQRLVAMQNGRARRGLEFASWQMLLGNAPWLASEIAAETTYGAQRMSAPEFKAMFQDLAARVGGRLLLIPAEKFAEDAPQPTDEQITAHFERYKNDLPGEGEHGFGYRLPDRVSLEYIEIPFESAMAKVKVAEHEAVAFYDDNPAAFVEPPEADANPEAEPVQTPYLEVKDQIKRYLRTQKAQSLVDEVTQFMLGRLTDSERMLGEDPEDRRYKLVPEDFASVDFQALALEAEERFDIELNVVRRGDRWSAVSDFPELRGIGMSNVADAARPLSFADYVATAQTFNPTDENPAALLRLQSGVVARPMVGEDQSRYLFRLVGAEASQPRESYADIREAVAADVRRFGAYQMLRDDAGALKARAATEGLDALAEELGLTVGRINPVQQRPMGRTQEEMVANIPGIGRDAGLIDAMFSRAQTLSRDGELDELPASSRVVAAPIDGVLKLAVVELADYSPVTRSEYAEGVALPEVRMGVSLSLVSFAEESPYSLPLIKQRLGYESDDDAPEDEGADETNAGTDEAADAS